MDVKNAFNSADWDATYAAIDGKDIPNYLLQPIKHYFKDRVLLNATEDCRKSYAASLGLPQGSVVDPILWNVVYDGVLRLKLPKVTQIIEFQYLLKIPSLYLVKL